MLRDILEAWSLARRGEKIGRGPLEGQPDPELPDTDRISISGMYDEFEIFVDGKYIGEIQYAGYGRNWEKIEDFNEDDWEWTIPPINLIGTARTPVEAITALWGFYPMSKQSSKMKGSEIPDETDKGNRSRKHKLLGLPPPEFDSQDWRSPDKGSEDWESKLLAAMAEMKFKENTTPRQLANRTRTFYRDFKVVSGYTYDSDGRKINHRSRERIGLGLFRLNDRGVSNYVRVKRSTVKSWKDDEWRMYGRDVDVSESIELFKKYLKNIGVRI